MRILGEIPHPSYKISVFKQDQRLILKVEDRLNEQIFKFRMIDGLESFEDMGLMVDEAFLEDCARRFHEMDKSVVELMGRHATDSAEEGDLVIV